MSSKLFSQARDLTFGMPLTVDDALGLQGELDALVEQSVPPNSLPLACHSGCGHCCSQRVVALPHEVALVFSAASETELAAAATVGRRHHRATAEQSSLVSCPLLDRAQRCSVYSVRPRACRAEHSFSVAACAKGYGHTHPFDGNRSAAYRMVLLGAIAGLHERQLDVQPVELASGLTFLLAKYPRSRGAALTDWLKGRRLFSRALYREAWRQRDRAASQEDLIQLGRRKP